VMIGFATERVRACSLFAPAGSLMAVRLRPHRDNARQTFLNSA
jgi:hypothetical protein